MRIGHFMDGIFYPGGVATYIRQISAAQRQQGHDILFFDFLDRKPPEPQDGAAVDAGGSNLCVQYARDKPHLFALARQQDVDILHVHCGIAASARDGVPVIRTIHGHQPYCPSGTRYLMRTSAVCERRVSIAGCGRGHLLDRCGSARPANMLADWQRTRQEQHNLNQIPAICNSAYMKREMVTAGYDAARLHVVLYAASGVDAYVPPPDPAGGMPARFVFLGRLTSLKGVDWLLRALARMTTPAHLDIAGTGPEEEPLRHLAARLGLAERVHFHGWLERGGVRTLLQEARAIVFPSLWPEPAGLVSLEAAAAGRAIVGSRVGGIPEYALHEQNALLVAPGDVDALTGALQQVADDWPLACRLGAQGRQLAQEHFTIQRHADHIEQLYRQCIAAQEQA